MPSVRSWPARRDVRRHTSSSAPALLAGLVGIGLIVGVGDVSSATHLRAGRLSSACTVPQGAGPGYNAAIGIRQNGKTICIVLGERLAVFLSAPTSNSPPWRTVRMSNSSVLTHAPLTVLLTRGTTASNFAATRVGTVKLTSQRRVCAQPTSGQPTCDSIEAWSVVVVVHSSGRPKPPSPTGVYGVVTAGPTCPVQRIDEPCPAEPVSAEVEVRYRDGTAVASAHTDAAGDYSIPTPPGSYRLVIATGSALPRCPSPDVTVAYNSPSLTNVSCDTGIR